LAALKLFCENHLYLKFFQILGSKRPREDTDDNNGKLKILKSNEGSTKHALNQLGGTSSQEKKKKIIMKRTVSITIVSLFVISIGSYVITFYIQKNG
jgi:hypothetical protein